MTLDQVRRHLRNECIYTIFECKNCGERGPYHLINGGAHTKDHCIQNLKRKNQQITTDVTSLIK